MVEMKRLCLVCLTGSVVACESGLPTEGVVVSDSAGIEIVEIPAKLATQAWATVTDTLLALGEAEGAEDILFDRIRAVRLLADGSIALADGGSQEIRVFAEDGQLESRFGGSGEGPGESLYLWALDVIGGDSIIAHDWRTRRVSLFTRHGQVVQDWLLPTGAPGELVGHLEGRTLLLTDPSALVGTDGAEGRVRTPRHYVEVELGTSAVDTVATVPGFEFLATNGGATTYELPFARDAFQDVGQEGWFTGRNDSFEIERRDNGGRITRLIRVIGLDRRLTEDQIDDVKRRTIQAVDPTPARRESIERLFQASPPEFWPAFGAIVADRVGRLWVSDWVSRFSEPLDQPRIWWTFDDRGFPMGQVEFPPSFSLHDADLARVVGVQTDDLGVERVLVLRLHPLQDSTLDGTVP